MSRRTMKQTSRQHSQQCYQTMTLRTQEQLQTACVVVAHTLRSLIRVDTEEEPIMPAEYYTRCFASSFLALFSIAVAYRQELYLLAFQGAAVMLTSVNYWRHPTLGFRRLLDVAVVLMAFATHLHYSTQIVEIPHGKFYWLCCAIGVAFYLKSKQCGLRKDFDGDSKYHMGLHAMGNVANIILYVGLGSLQ